MAKKSIAEKKAELEAQLKALEEQERALEFERLSALGAGLQAAFDADANLQGQVMGAIEKALKNNKQRELLGFDKLASNRGRPKATA